MQNGNAFQSTEVTFGQTSGDMVEVKTGLFEGDMVVTQRATQLYAQSLRGDSKKEEGHAEEEKTEVKANNFPVPLWLMAAGGGSVITAIAFSTSNLLSRRKSPHLATAGVYGEETVTYETDTQIYLDNHKQTDASPTPISVEKQENS